MQKKYEHLFFDLDHTLWDFEENSKYVIMELFHRLGLEEILTTNAEEFFQSFSIINEKLWERYRKGYINRDLLRWKRFYKVFLEYGYNNESLAKEISDEYLKLLPKQNKLLPFAKEILDHCQSKNYVLHIITNGFEQTQYEKMDNAQITHYFKEIITSEKCNSLKPNKIIFNFAYSSTGASAHNSLMIGDSWEADIVGAKDVGMDQVFYNPLQKMTKGKATYEIKCLSELMEII